MDSVYCVAVEISCMQRTRAMWTLFGTLRAISWQPCHDADLVAAGPTSWQPGQIADLLWGELSGHFSSALLEGELTFVAYGGEAFRTLSRVAASGFALSARSATLHWITYRRT